MSETPPTWTLFWDMSSGGTTKEEPYNCIYIEAPKEEAKVIFYNRFGHNPERVSCTCCGQDYSISEDPLRQLSGFHRGCDNLETPRDPETGRYGLPSKDTEEGRWFRENYYLEPGQEIKYGFKSRVSPGKRMVLQESGHTATIPFTEWLKNPPPDVLLVRAADIKDEERQGTVPEQGYIWAD